MERLGAINAPIAEEDQVVTLLGSLPSSYSALVTALDARDTISVSYVQQSLIREEQKLKGDSKLDGSMNAGAGQALCRKQESQKMEDINTRSATCVGSPDIFVGIV